MKKVLSIVLVLMMVLTSAAFATEVASTTLTSSEGKAQTTATDSTTAETVVWMTVAPEGTIDVTLPLVLLFATNINGGSANTTDGTYYIENNSTADLMVTDMTCVDNDTPYTETGSDTQRDMTLTAYAESITDEDNYGVKFTANDYTGKTTTEIDASTCETTVSSLTNGIWLLKSNDAKDQETAITVNMTTGPLSFTTGTGLGVKLLTVTYTIKIDSSNTVGENLPEMN